MQFSSKSLAKGVLLGDPSFPLLHKLVLLAFQPFCGVHHLFLLELSCSHPLPFLLFIQSLFSLYLILVLSDHPLSLIYFLFLLLLLSFYHFFLLLLLCLLNLLGCLVLLFFLKSFFLQRLSGLKQDIIIHWQIVIVFILKTCLVVYHLHLQNGLQVLLMVLGDNWFEWKVWGKSKMWLIWEHWLGVA